MKAAKIRGLDTYTKQLQKELMEYWTTEQTKRLVEYAKRKILIIAGYLRNGYTYGFDRTGNLLDSLCWVVSYNGELAESGFYREQTASKNAYMHELSDVDTQEMFPVYGHALAEDFIERWGKKSKKGEWGVYFAILAPYWGFWEHGHKNVLTHKYERFAVMAEMYDSVSKDLKPAKTEFIHSRPHYNKAKLKKMRENMDKSPYKEKRHYDRWPSLQ